MSSEGKRRKLASENRKEKRPFVTHQIPPLPTLFVLSSQPSFLPGYQPQGPIFTQPRPVLSPSRLTVLPPSNLSTLFQKKRESKKTRPPVFKFSSHSHIPCVCTYIYGRGKRKALSNAKPRKRSRHAGLPLFPKFERKKKAVEPFQPRVQTGALTKTCRPRTSTAIKPAKRTFPGSLGGGPGESGEHLVSLQNTQITRWQEQ